MLASTVLTLALASFAAAAPIDSSLITVLNSVTSAVALPNTTQTNNATWYNQNGVAGACGLHSQDSDVVVGLPLEFYNETGTVSTYCGAYVVVLNLNNNLTTTARVADASATNGSLSLSVATYAALEGAESNLDVVEWRFANKTETDAAKALLMDADSADVSSYVAPMTSSSSSAAKAAATPSPASSNDDDNERVAPASSSSEWVAPAPSSSKWVEPTSKWVAPASSTSQWVAPSSSARVQASTSFSGSFSGSATFYFQGGNAGSCGQANDDSAVIVAMNTPQVDGGSHCGKYVTVKNTANGKTVTAKVADQCPGCGYGSLDLSTGAYDQIGSRDSGVLPITWSWA